MEAGDNTDGVHERGDDGDSGSQDGREGRNLRRQESEGNGNRAPDMWDPPVSYRVAHIILVGPTCQSATG
jgi:hypothetical protein